MALEPRVRLSWMTYAIWTLAALALMGMGVAAAAEHRVAYNFFGIFAVAFGVLRVEAEVSSTPLLPVRVGLVLVFVAGLTILLLGEFQLVAGSLVTIARFALISFWAALLVLRVLDQARPSSGAAGSEDK